MLVGAVLVGSVLGCLALVGSMLEWSASGVCLWGVLVGCACGECASGEYTCGECASGGFKRQDDHTTGFVSSSSTGNHSGTPPSPSTSRDNRPICVLLTFASVMPKPWLQMVPHVPLYKISNRPELALPLLPVSRMRYSDCV